MSELCMYCILCILFHSPGLSPVLKPLPQPLECWEYRCVPAYFPKQEVSRWGRGHQTRPQDDEGEGSKAATDIFDRNTLLQHAGKTKEPWSSSEHTQELAHRPRSWLVKRLLQLLKAKGIKSSRP